MGQFFPFFVVLFAGVFFSGLFKRFHLPWAVALLIGGMIIGPHGLGFFEIDPTISFIGQLGLIFLMFMAGLETKFSSFKTAKKEIFWLALINGGVPLIVGFSIAVLLGFGNMTAILLGIIFISSSVAVIIPSLELNNLISTRLGKDIMASIVVQDIVSLVLLSIFLQSSNPNTVLPLPLFYLLLLISILVVRWAIPRVRWVFSVTTDERDRKFFQRELRSIFAILIGTVIIFEILGLHPIIAGFFAGLVLSDSIKSNVLMDKIRTISYGLFVPTFFVVAGAQTDIGVFANYSNIFIIAILIIFGSMLSKYFSGYYGARLMNFSISESKMFAFSSIPQLSTTLAVVYTALELNLLNQSILTSMVLLSIISTFVGPVMMKSLSNAYNFQ